MPQYGVAITKRNEWRGSQQEHATVYHLFAPTGQTFDDVQAINALVAAERPIYSTEVSFVKARTWGPTGQGPAVSDTRTIMDLTGTGAGGIQAGFYRELATMVYWPLGRYGTRNRPQFLRKWLRLCRSPAVSQVNWSNGSVAGTQPTEITNYITQVTTVGASLYNLCNETGRQPTGPGKMYPYLEHRQLGQ